jgi:hypothetical protein
VGSNVHEDLVIEDLGTIKHGRSEEMDASDERSNPGSESESDDG